MNWSATVLIHSRKLFVEILSVNATYRPTWFDVRKVMRTWKHRFGRAEPDASQRACGTGRAAVAPAPERNVGHYSGLYRQ